MSATPVAITCVKKLNGIKGKKVIPFITMSFPFQWMGGKHAAKQISQLALAAGATAVQGAIVTKMFHDYTAQMDREAIRLADKL
jgi:hypothetical protein